MTILCDNIKMIPMWEMNPKNALQHCSIYAPNVISIKILPSLIQCIYIMATKIMFLIDWKVIFKKLFKQDNKKLCLGKRFISVHSLKNRWSFEHFLYFLLVIPVVEGVLREDHSRSNLCPICYFWISDLVVSSLVCVHRVTHTPQGSRAVSSSASASYPFIADL